jgi:hypothetical protein
VLLQDGTSLFDEFDLALKDRVGSVLTWKDKVLGSPQMSRDFGHLPRSHAEGPAFPPSPKPGGRKEPKAAGKSQRVPDRDPR